jgi:hypothetical protein
MDNLHNFSSSMKSIIIFNLFTHICVAIFWQLANIWALYVEFWGVVWMVQVVHCSLCRVLYIRKIIKVVGVFVSCNLFYTSYSCGLQWKHICNFQYPNKKTKTNFIDVDCGIYIPKACPFCQHVKEAFTKLDLLTKVFLHHIMHYKPIWISSMDACNHNHEIYEIICAKWGVCLGVSMSQGLYSPSGICQKCWQKRTIYRIMP